MTLETLVNGTLQPELPRKGGFLTSPPVHFMILVLLAVIIYSNTFQVPMLFDDESSIIANPLIQDLGHYFGNSEGYNDRPNRYIGYLSFALNYHFGGLNVAGYHAVNLAIHIVTTLLVYGLARLTLRTPLFGRDRQVISVKQAESFIPFCAALLFAVHPVQTQAVTYIVQRLTSLATLFYLASLVLHARWRLAQEKGSRFACRAVLPFWLLSLLCALLAMKTKEIAFTLPLAVLLFEFCFFGRPGRRLWPLLTPILLTLTIIPWTTLTLSGPAADILARMDAATAVKSPLSRGEYLYTQFSVIVTYLRLLVLPVNQNLDYDYPVNRTVFDPQAMLSLLFLLALLALAGYLCYRTGVGAREASTGLASSEASEKAACPSAALGPLWRLCAFGIFWFFITLAVESSVIPIRDIIFEHRVYLPSVGFFLAAAAMAAAALARLQGRAPALVPPASFAAMVLVLLLAGASYARNEVWRDPLVLWQDAKAKSPGKARPHNVLGTYYAEMGQVTEAIREFESSLRLEPAAPDVLSILADSYRVAGRHAEAAATYRMLATASGRPAGAPLP